MKPGAIIAGYFVVAIAFFLLGRLTAHGTRVAGHEPPSEAQGEAANTGPLRVDLISAAPSKGPSDGASQPQGPAPDPSPSVGPVDAPVILLEISDFQCPVCKRAYEPLKQLEKDAPGLVRLVFKHNPLQMHRNALVAAAASIAASRQGRFWEYADRLFANQAALSESDLMGYAKELGLDMERFQKDFYDPGVRARAKEEGDTALELGARGTPAFIINGRLQVGWASYESILQMVRQEAEAVQRLVSSGKSLREARLERVKANMPEAQRFLSSILAREFFEP